MSDLRSILKKNLTNIIENTNVTVELCAQLQDRGLVKRAAYQKLTKFQREEDHAEGAVYIYQNVVPTLDKVGEISFVEALRDGGNAKVVEILNEAGYVKPSADIQEKLSAFASTEITEVKSVVMRNLGDNKYELNLNETDGLACWPKNHQNKQAFQRQGAIGKRFALIVNVVRDREGSEMDECRLSKTLKKCRFDVKIVQKKNRTKENLLGKVKKFRDNIVGEEWPVEGIFVALMSHGHDNTMFQTEDRKIISIEEIIEEFSTEKSLSLKDVPKVFLINMCRGEAVQKDCVNQDVPELPFSWEDYWSKLFEESRHEDSEVVKDEFDSARNPTWKTFYFGFSTAEGSPSLRNAHSTKESEKIGAWFVIDFCEALEDKILNGQSTPISTIFEEAKQLVIVRGNSGKHKGIQEPIHYNVGFEDHIKYQLP